eukprot:COSAG01_NODE_1695_length_9464_cov_4.884677_11_plen_73_part_00
MKANRTVVLAAVADDPFAPMYASDELRADGHSFMILVLYRASCVLAGRTLWNIIICGQKQSTPRLRTSQQLK